MGGREIKLTAIAIVLGGIAATSLVWESSTIPAGSNCTNNSSGGTPLGTALAFGTIVESVVGSNHWYNATVQTSEGLPLNDMEYGVISQSGNIIPPGPNWSFSLLNSSGDRIDAAFSANGLLDKWTTSSSLLLDAGEQVSLQTSLQNISAVGDRMIILEVGTNPNGCSAHEETLLSIP